MHRQIVVLYVSGLLTLLYHVIVGLTIQLIFNLWKHIINVKGFLSLCEPVVVKSPEIRSEEIAVFYWVPPSPIHDDSIKSCFFACSYQIAKEQHRTQTDSVSEELLLVFSSFVILYVLLMDKVYRLINISYAAHAIKLWRPKGQFRTTTHNNYAALIALFLGLAEHAQRV